MHSAFRKNLDTRFGRFNVSVVLKIAYRRSPDEIPQLTTI